VSPLDRAFADWYADREATSWWNGDHECDDLCDCAIEARATAIANDSLILDDESADANA
jgi:hypothetical protein